MLAVTFAFAFGGLACAQTLATDEAKESYSLGASVGKYLSGQIYKQTELGLPVDLELVIAGIVDALHDQSKLTGDETITFLNSRADKLNAIQETVIEKMVEENKGKSEKFLAENKAKKGVVETASGLQYEIVSEGKGITPHEEDVVTIEYTGKLPDGTYFEGSDKEKKTDKFVVMTVVPGLQEGLGLMKEGSEYQFAIPAKLAYGVHGAGPIPPESVILFDIKLVKVEKPGANKEVNPDGQPKKAWPHG